MRLRVGVAVWLVGVMQLIGGVASAAASEVIIIDVDGYEIVTHLLIQEPHGVVLVGSVSESAFAPESDVVVQRYNFDGVLDSSFGNDGTFRADFGFDRAGAQHAVLNADGSILVVGTASRGHDIDGFVFLLDAGGSLIETFGTAGVASISGATPEVNSYESAKSVHVLSDGRLVVVGDAADSSGEYVMVALLEASGDLDPTFAGDGILATDLGGRWVWTGAATVSNSDRIVVWGTDATDSDVFTFSMKLNTSGELVSTYGVNGIVEHSWGAIWAEPVYAKTLPDGDFVVLADQEGNQSGVDRDPSLIRYQPDGTRDLSFGVDGEVRLIQSADEDRAARFDVTPDGGFVFGGVSYSLDGYPNSESFLAQVTAKGQLDAGFASGGLASFHISDKFERTTAVGVQADGSVWAAGMFYLDDASTLTDSYLVRYTDSLLPQQPLNWFTDDDGHLFETDIDWIASKGITKGCNPLEGNTRYCPNDYVTRGQMAAFLVRALDLSVRADNPFTDDDGSIFEADIDRLAAAGITKGCNPSEGNTKFCPNGFVTRAQMASFLVRALGYTDDGGGNLFHDDDSSVHETDIDRLGTAGVTKGCNPPTNDLFCPNDYVTRGQMAAFLHRALR